jgi:hypothetical protein
MVWRNHNGQVVHVVAPPALPLEVAIGRQRRRLEAEMTGDRKP